MSVEQSLLSAILANPGDDAPRLVYADWQMEFGNESLGEFIHTQIAISLEDPHYFLSYQTMDKVHAKSANPAIRRAAELLQAAWGTTLISLGYGIDGVRFEFRRGFPETIPTTASGWLAYGPKMVNIWPVDFVSLIDHHAIKIGAQYFWAEREFGAHGFQDGLPSFVFARLSGKYTNPNFRSLLDTPMCGPYPTAEAAVQALSNACLCYARNRLGESSKMLEFHADAVRKLGVVSEKYFKAPFRFTGPF